MVHQYKHSTRVYLAAGIALLGALAVGYTIGFPDSASLTLLKKEDEKFNPKCNKSDKAGASIMEDNEVEAMMNSNSNKSDNVNWFQISSQQNSFNGGIMPLAALFGAMAGGPVSDWIGRKLTLIIIGVPFSLGWLVIGLAAVPQNKETLSFVMLLIGRFITGFFTGFVCSVVPTYLVEISTPQIRGTIGTFFQILITVGIFLISFFGVFATEDFDYFFKWYYIAYIGIIPTLLMTIGMVFMPESHVWIFNRSGKGPAAAEISLQVLRTGSSDKKEELADLQKAASQQDQRFHFFGDFKKLNVWKPLLLALGLMFFQQFSGINAVMFYLAEIFKKAGMGKATAYASAGVKFVQVLATLAASFLIDRLGRKKLLIASGAGHTVSLILFVIYFYALYDECAKTASIFNKIFAVFCLTIYIIAFSIGWGPIPWLMVAEITPGFARGVISSIATVFNWTSAFVVAQTYPPVADAIGPGPTFAFFAIICFGSIFFTIFLLPETKGKTFDEIQAYFGAKVEPPPAEKVATASKSKDVVAVSQSKGALAVSQSKDALAVSQSKDAIAVSQSKDAVAASQSKDAVSAFF